jgi:SRSO17 transposase
MIGLHQGSLRQEGAAIVGPERLPPTVGVVDQYCTYDQGVSPEVRSFEQLKYLHLGLLAELPRKTLPAMARVLGLEDEPSWHHCLAHSPWEITPLRDKRLQVVKQVVRGRPLMLGIDETADKKKGKTTDDVARQYIGNLGKIDHGIGSVAAKFFLRSSGTAGLAAGCRGRGTTFPQAWRWKKR